MPHLRHLSADPRHHETLQVQFFESQLECADVGVTDKTVESALIVLDFS
jgi:hypothetical protein